MDFRSDMSRMSNSLWIKSSMTFLTGSQLTVIQSTLSWLRWEERTWLYGLMAGWSVVLLCFFMDHMYLGRDSDSFPLTFKALKFLSQSSTEHICLSTNFSRSTRPNTNHSCNTFITVKLKRLDKVLAEGK